MKRTSIVACLTTCFAAAASAQGDLSSRGPASSSFLQRHYKVLQAEVGTRVRYADTGPGAVVDRDLHYKFLARVRFDLDGKGNSFFQMRSETGNGFASDFNYTGWGRGSHTPEVNVKSFFFGQKFGRLVEAHVGGIEFDYGAGSQATSGDVDGWMVGYRTKINGSGRGWQPSKLQVTWGYVGDLNKLNVFSRLHRLNEANYVQVLAQRRLNDKTDSSVDFSSLRGVPYMRAALARQAIGVHVIDDVVLESIVRTARGRTFGWSATLAKKLDSHWRAGLNFSDIPKDTFELYGKPFLYNGDSFGLGQRVGLTLKYLPTKNLELSWFASHRIDDTPGHRQRVQMMVKYQLSDLLNHLR